MTRTEDGRRLEPRLESQRQRQQLGRRGRGYLETKQDQVLACWPPG